MVCFAAVQHERSAAAARPASTDAAQTDEDARQDHQSEWTCWRRLRSLYTTVFFAAWSTCTARHVLRCTVCLCGLSFVLLILVRSGSQMFGFRLQSRYTFEPRSTLRRRRKWPLRMRGKSLSACCKFRFSTQASVFCRRNAAWQRVCPYVGPLQRYIVLKQQNVAIVVTIIMRSVPKCGPGVVFLHRTWNM